MLPEALAVGAAPEQKKQGPMKMSIVASDSKLFDYDDQRSGRSSKVAYERPLIAVPFKWEAEPGVPKLKPVGAASKSGGGLQQSPKLPPPPRLKTLLQDNNAAAAGPSPLLSPRSPRSISLSKKMKSLLQGKLSMYSNSRRISDERISSSLYGSERSHESSSSSSLFWEDSAAELQTEHMDVPVSCVALGDSDHIVLKGEQLSLRMEEPRSSDFSYPPAQQGHSGFMPFKNMSTMLLELWYGGNVYSADSSEGHQIFDISPTSSSSSDSLESPGSYNSVSSFSSEYNNPPPPTRHDAFGKDDCYDQLPKEFQDLDFDEHDWRDDEDFSIDFDYCSSSDFLLVENLYKSDRFRVESSESASLVVPQRPSESVEPLPSALKSGKKASNRNVMKRVRFADDGLPSTESSELLDSPKSSPVLERYSSRPAARFSDDDADNMPSAEEESCYSSPSPSPSPSPRARRDLSELFMQIVQADAELTRRQKRGVFKSMFRSTKRC